MNLTELKSNNHFFFDIYFVFENKSLWSYEKSNIIMNFDFLLIFGCWGVDLTYSRVDWALLVDKIAIKCISSK